MCGFALRILVCLLLTSSFVSSAERVDEADYLRLETYRANLLTKNEEQAVGRRLAYLYEKRHTPLDDAKAQARLKKIIQRLGQAIDIPPLDIVVLKSSEPDAVSFPPNRIFITSALLNLARTDDELAAVIAHELAHLNCRHLTRLIALSLTLPDVERKLFPTREAIVTGQVSQFAFPNALDETRLLYEIEADRRAAVWLESASYNAEALATLLGKLTAQLPPQVSREQSQLKTRFMLLAKS